MIVESVTIEVDKKYFEYMRTGKGEMDTRSEVVMVLPRPGGRVLTLTKSFYPSGIYNLPSGGMHPGETPQQAFAREVSEETGLTVALQSRIGRIDHILTSAGGQTSVTSHIILGTESTETPHPSDEGEDINEYKDAGIEDLRRCAEQMRSLTGRWLGFGRFRSTALDLVADYLANLPALPD